jgi:uncharacterized protein (DUF58 family)
MTKKLHCIDPLQLAQINDLQLLARTVVEGFMVGLHRSPFTGASIEFAQYRPYVQGDDPRFVDWSLYARTDRLHSKQFHKDTNLRCTLLLDQSASMRYTSGTMTKFQYARMITACLTMLLFRQNDAAGFLSFHKNVEIYMPPRCSHQHTQQILVALDSMKPSGETNLSETLSQAGTAIPRKGLLILLSDLLSPLSDLIPNVKQLRAQGHDIIIFQISDPQEQHFTFTQSATLVDAETQSEIFMVPDAVRDEYLRNREAHFKKIRSECLSAEIDIEEFTTTEPLDRALHFFLQQRNRLLLSSSARRTSPRKRGL